jgi:hypothetical protein
LKNAWDKRLWIVDCGLRNKSYNRGFIEINFVLEQKKLLLQNLLQMNQENQNIEWKESWRDEQLKTICGFPKIRVDDSNH